jgi:hypothetical protein
MKTIKLYVYCVVTLLITACSGNGDNISVTSQTTAAPSKGIFTDSPVSGIEYRTESVHGITDSDGGFQYFPGETVTFSIGDVVIGTSLARSKVTPIDLSSSQNDTNPTTINIARFLQSLDRDGNHENGIQITPEIRHELVGKKIDFGKSVSDFDDSNMRELFTSLNNKNVFSDGAQRGLISDLEAQYNLRHTLNPTLSPFDGEWTASYLYPVPTGSGINPPPEIPTKEYDTDTAKITISANAVTFVPATGRSLSGTIDKSGVIKVPDRTISCKDPFGVDLVLSSKLTMNSNGTINGEWWLGLPLAAPGYCYPYLIKANLAPVMKVVDPGSFTITGITP